MLTYKKGAEIKTVYLVAQTALHGGPEKAGTPLPIATEKDVENVADVDPEAERLDLQSNRIAYEYLSKDEMMGQMNRGRSSG
jgi:hypothetical protein